MRRAPIAAVALLLAACAPDGEPPTILAAPAEPLVWPQPPAQPRIKFLFGFAQPADLGIKPSFLTRVWESIVGEEPQGMVRPYAIAVQGTRIAVADPGLGAVHLFDPATKSYQRIVTAGEEALVSPVGVAFGPGRLYVADSATGRIFGLTEAGEVALRIEGVTRPTGLAYDAEHGRLYVADTLAHRIEVFDDAGQRLFTFGTRGTGPGEFNFPTHIFLRDGRLYVNDTMNFRLQTFDLDGHALGSFGRHGDGSGDFAQPKGIAVDPEGHLYVADALFDRIQIFDGDGHFLLSFGGTGMDAGDFWLPAGVFAVDDRIYVADSYNRRVQVFQFLGGG